MFEKIRERIEQLRARIAAGSPDDARVKEEFRSLYIEISNALKFLTQAQEDLRKVAMDAKAKRAGSQEADRFYSVVRSRTALELDVSTLLDRAWNLIVLEDYDEAISVLKKVLAIDGKNVKGLDFMGLSLMNKELYDDAMMFFQKVLLVDPENAFALNNLGYICYKKGIWGEAIEHLTRASKQTKDRTAALYATYYLGLVYFERGMLEDAVKFFLSATRLGPNLQEAYYYLGLTEMKRYEFKAAIGYFEHCIKIDATSRYSTLARVEMDKIRPLIDPSALKNETAP